MGNAVSQYDQVYTVKSRNFHQFKNKNFQQKRAHKPASYSVTRLTLMRKEYRPHAISKNQFFQILLFID